MSDTNTTAAKEGWLDNALHLPGHVWDWLVSHSPFLSALVKSKPAQEIAAYEKTHGAEQLAAIKKAGMNVYAADRAKGIDKGTAILAAIRAAFECGVAEVKSLSTMAMTLLLTEAAAELDAIV